MKSIWNSTKIKENTESLYKREVLCMVKRGLALPHSRFLEIESDGNFWLLEAKRVLPKIIFKHYYRKYCKKVYGYLVKSEFLLNKTSDMYKIIEFFHNDAFQENHITEKEVV